MTGLDTAFAPVQHAAAAFGTPTGLAAKARIAPFIANDEKQGNLQQVGATGGIAQGAKELSALVQQAIA